MQEIKYVSYCKVGRMECLILSIHRGRNEIYAGNSRSRGHTQQSRESVGNVCTVGFWNNPTNTATFYN